MKGYELKNDLLSVRILEQGATLASLRYKGTETLLQYEKEEDFRENPYFFGAVVGRYANRIGGSKFSLDGREYTLAANEGKNILHSGPNAPCHRDWTLEEQTDTSLRLSYFSPDGDNGFPGAIKMSVTYTVRGGTLRLDFEGECDAPTVYAPTVHPYFRLSDPVMQVFASGHVETDGELIPTGRILPCEGDFDMAEPKPLPLTLDDAFVLSGEHALTLKNNGCELQLRTDFPAAQVYSRHPNGVAIEPEFYPDSPNHPEFPSTVLRPGEHFHRWAEYRFSDID